MLTFKAIQACKEYGVQRLIVAGGVASNKGLRQSLADQCKVNDIQLTIPSPKLCTDNAEGVAGHYLYQQGRFADLALNGHSNIDLEEYSAE